MEQDFVLQLQEKNLEILKNKLKLDVANNMNSLTLSLNHILDLEVASALSKLIIIYQDVSSDIKEDQLQQILIQVGQKYLDEMKQYLKKKRTDIFGEINSLSLPFEVTQFCNLLDLVKDGDISIIKETLISYIEKMSIPTLKDLNKTCVIEANREFVFSREMAFLTDHFVRRLIDKTEEQLHIRSQTFINNANSNYEHYSALPTGL